MKTDDKQSSETRKELRYPDGTKLDPTEEGLVLHGLPINRENYEEYNGVPMDKLGAEQWELVPRWLQEGLEEPPEQPRWISRSDTKLSPEELQRQFDEMMPRHMAQMRQEALEQWGRSQPEETEESSSHTGRKGNA
jgi:hypothetical protein